MGTDEEAFTARAPALSTSVRTTPRASSVPCARLQCLPCNRARSGSSFRPRRWLPPRGFPVWIAPLEHLSDRAKRVDHVMHMAAGDAWKSRSSRFQNCKRWWFQECRRTRQNFTAPARRSERGSRVIFTRDGQHGMASAAPVGFRAPIRVAVSSSESLKRYIKR
jgi:hypothetical protein